MAKYCCCFVVVSVAVFLFVLFVCLFVCFFEGGGGRGLLLSTILAYICYSPALVGPYREKLCPRSRVRPETAGRGPYSRPPFPYADRPRPVNNVFIYLFIYLFSYLFIYLIFTKFENIQLELLKK